MQRGLTVEQKMKAMREVQEIYALAKKWRRNLPDERRPDFENMADRIMRRALELPTVAPEPRAPIYPRATMAEQDPESAHVSERVRLGRAALLPERARKKCAATANGARPELPAR